MPADITGQLGQILPIILIFVVFIFLIIVPQRKRNKKAKEMMEGMKVGDRIKTIGGFYGRIIQVKDDIIIFECGPDKTKLELSKGAVAAVQGTEGENEQEITEAKK